MNAMAWPGATASRTWFMSLTTGPARVRVGPGCGAKAFIDQLTRVAAIEFASQRITVNAVGPGSTATGPFAGLPADRLAAMGVATFGLGRVGTPADAAALVAFLTCDEASFITGQVTYNTGGQRGPIGLAHRDDQ